jgi:hypothetical protein
MLWRVVYGRCSKELTAFSAGPWHPDKAHAERWAEWLRAHGHEAQVQSNGQAGSHLRGGQAHD